MDEAENDVCPVCHTDRQFNKNLRLLVSPCYHKMSVLYYYCPYMTDKTGVNHVLIVCSLLAQNHVRNVDVCCVKSTSHIRHSRI